MNDRAKFLKLKDFWYKKLHKSGFEDIERDEWTLKRPLSKIFQRRDGLVKSGRWEMRQQYYYMAEHFLNSYKFDSKFDENVWMYHSNGLGVREITKTLNKLRRKKKTNRDAVWKIIKKYEYIMRKLFWVKDTDTPTDEQ